MASLANTCTINNCEEPIFNVEKFIKGAEVEEYKKRFGGSKGKCLRHVLEDPWVRGKNA